MCSGFSFCGNVETKLGVRKLNRYQIDQIPRDCTAYTQMGAVDGSLYTDSGGHRFKVEDLHRFATEGAKEEFNDPRYVTSRARADQQDEVDILIASGPSWVTGFRTDMSGIFWLKSIKDALMRVRGLSEEAASDFIENHRLIKRRAKPPLRHEDPVGMTTVFSA
jgi:hypothetical protein